MDHETYIQQVEAIAAEYPLGMMVVVALAGPVPLPPPGIPDDEIALNMEMLRDTAQLMQQQAEAMQS